MVLPLAPENVAEVNGSCLRKLSAGIRKLHPMKCGPRVSERFLGILKSFPDVPALKMPGPGMPFQGGLFSM